MTRAARKGRHVAVATTAEITTAQGLRGDLVTADDGGVGIVGQGVVAVVGSSSPERVYQVRALIASIVSPAFTLSGDANTLTANANGALGTYLGLAYGMPVGSTALVLVGGTADGLWTVTVEGNGSTPAVLTRTTAYRTAAALPELVAFVSPVNLEVVTYAVVGTPPTPGSGPLPYYRVDSQAYNYATAIGPAQVAAAALLGAYPVRIPLIIPIDVNSAANDTPVVVPFGCTLVGFWAIVSTPAGASLGALRTAVGGGGSLLASVNTTTMGGTFEGVAAGISTPRTMAAGTYYLNRNDTTTRATFYAMIVRS